jgi:predicted metal-binding membrane protein
MEAMLRRQRLIVGLCLAVLAALAWLYLFHSRTTMGDTAGTTMAGMDMSNMNMPGMVMPGAEEWNFTAVLLLFAMWAIMMVAMMVPSAAPMVLAFVAVNHRRQTSGRLLVPVGIFLTGYLTIWTAYSAVAASTQWSLHHAALLSSAMKTTSPQLNGVLLIAAGVFQWTPLKRACLDGCRSPLTFLMSEWREGARGAFVMGLRHGTYCVGCCWILMALLFVAGVMNLLWVAAIACLVIAEKLFPKGHLVAHASGVAFVLGGAALIARSW